MRSMYLYVAGHCVQREVWFLRGRVAGLPQRVRHVSAGSQTGQTAQADTAGETRGARTCRCKGILQSVRGSQY